MITNFKIFEKESGSKIEIGDYVKFKPNISGWSADNTVGKLIFEVVDKKLEKDDDGEYDILFLSIEAVIEKYYLNGIPPYTVRHITDEERNELEMEMNTKKYNL